MQISLADVTLDDIWKLDLNKLDGWTCVKENTAGDDAIREPEDSDDDGPGGDALHDSDHATALLSGCSDMSRHYMQQIV